MRVWTMLLIALAATVATTTIYMNMQNAHGFGIMRIVLKNNTGSYIFTFDPPTTKVSTLAIPHNVAYEAMVVDIVARGRGTLNKTVRLMFSDNVNIAFRGTLTIYANGPANLTTSIYVDGQYIGTFSGNPISLTVVGREVLLKPVTISLAGPTLVTIRFTGISTVFLVQGVSILRATFDPEVEIE